MKTQAEINELKRDWENDPCWDLAFTEGFEDYWDELREFEIKKRNEWEQERIELAIKTSRRYGLGDNVEFGTAIMSLEHRLERLESQEK